MNDKNTLPQDNMFFDDEAKADALRVKFADALTPGYQVELDPDEAERAGAFVEDALSEQDASDSDADLVDATVPDVQEG